jgi:hypothetical protein
MPRRGTSNNASPPLPQGPTSPFGKSQTLEIRGCASPPLLVRRFDLPALFRARTSNGFPSGSGYCIHMPSIWFCQKFYERGMKGGQNPSPSHPSPSPPRRGEGESGSGGC